jgi:hypothetical protein
MIQERCHLGLAHRIRVALAIEEDEALDPVHVRFLGARAIVAAPDRLMHAIEQPRAGYLGTGWQSRVT